MSKVCNSASKAMLNADKPLQAVVGVYVHTCVRGWLLARVSASSALAYQLNTRHDLYVGIVKYLYRSKTKTCRVDEDAPRYWT